MRQQILLMNKCLECGVKEAINWYKLPKEAYCNELESIINHEDRICNKCYMKLWRRNTGQFQNFKEEFKKRFCSECKSDKTQVSITKKGYPHTKWVSDGNGGFLCAKCVKRTKYKEVRDAYNHRKIKFKDNFKVLEHSPKTGRCSWCPNNIFDGTCKVTHTHHIQYHDDDPIKDTVELCASCHRKETIRLAKM